MICENSCPPSPFNEYCLEVLPIISENYSDTCSSSTSVDTSERQAIPLYGCNCVKTKCVKRYCECFANGRSCNSLCKCYQCKNKENSETRLVAITEAYERNPLAFEHSRFTATRGCNCKWSGCKKKYCQCFLNGVSCAASCMCENCLNIKTD